MPGKPSALSPTSASQSGIDAGGTPNFSVTPISVSVVLRIRSRQTMRFAVHALGEVFVRRTDHDLFDGRRCGETSGRGRDGVVGFEFDHRPRDDAERASGVFGESELRKQRGVDAFAGLVAGVQPVAERFDHVIERDADVRDVRFREQHEHRTQQSPHGADFRAIDRLFGRRAVERSIQFVRAVDEMDFHVALLGRGRGREFWVRLL